MKTSFDSVLIFQSLGAGLSQEQTWIAPYDGTIVQINWLLDNTSCNTAALNYVSLQSSSGQKLYTAGLPQIGGVIDMVAGKTLDVFNRNSPVSFAFTKNMPLTMRMVTGAFVSGTCYVHCMFFVTKY